MKLLFVVTAFYPEQAIGAVRITKFAKYCVRSGIDVSVISLPPPPWAKHDNNLYCDELVYMRLIQIPQSWLFRKFLQTARISVVGNSPAIDFVTSQKSRFNFLSNLKSLAQLLYTLLKAIDWVIQVRLYSHRSLAGENYDAIISSYPSFASPFAALALSSVGFSDVVVTDFRDPISYGQTSKFGLRHLLERWIVSRVQSLTYVSQGVFDKVIHNVPAGKVHSVITNGFDPDDASSLNDSPSHPIKSSVLRFIYAGSLYGGKRSLDLFFRAIQEVYTDRFSSCLSLEFHYAGNDSSLFLNQARQYKLSDHVVLHGLISRSDSLKLQLNSDICLVSTWNSAEDKGIMTGKIFECFMLRKPVIAIVNGPLPNSELASVVRSVSAGFCVENADSASYGLFLKWLEAMLEVKISTGLIPETYSNAIHNYEYPYLTKLLLKSIP